MTDTQIAVVFGALIAFLPTLITLNIKLNHDKSEKEKERNFKLKTDT